MSDEKNPNIPKENDDINPADKAENSGNSDNNQDDIDLILKDFQRKKEMKENAVSPSASSNRDFIDFAKTDETKSKKKSPKDAIKKGIEKVKKRFKKIHIDRKKLFKYLGLTLAIIAIVAAAAACITYGVQQSKISYLKPYENKYPDVEFPTGIMEKYCDIYGENPTAVGYINIDEINLSSPVLEDENDTYPYAEDVTQGSEQFNYVVYLNDNSLESYYSSADAYNSYATGYITYSDLFNDYRFKVVGAFYTNTTAADDDGYIFPYNVTEKMTQDSFVSFFDRLESRFLYNTGITLTRQDTLLTISCPTDYRENFRFVIVCVLRNDSTEKATAQENTNVHYPQIIYDENGEENPYRFSSKWYPEIIIKKGDSETSQQQSIIDYD